MAETDPGLPLQSSMNGPVESAVAILIKDDQNISLPLGSTLNQTAEIEKETAVFIQDVCLQHRYIRSRDTSSIVERPERLRAVHIGLATAKARIENVIKNDNSKNVVDAGDELVMALGKMNLAADPLESNTVPVSVVLNSASIDMFNHPAVKFVHGDLDGDVYLDKLKVWARDSHDKVSKGEPELPEDLPQGDLYLCPTSIDAIQGALGAVCQAVDTVIQKQPCNRVFVSIRPPGHHCGEDTPSGFCFVNNVAVAAAHAHLQYGIKRVVILDIDLHHGNGTQSIAWQVNEETYRQTLESEQLDSEGDPHPSEKIEKPGLQIYYGSIHDILSYPCENGKIDLVQAASVSLHGPHGQYIENIHLQQYTSDRHFFDVLYKDNYSQLLNKAKAFIESTGGQGDDVLVFISCGFDACEHEYPSMSRHRRKVPTSFYHRFTADACAFADHYAQGRVVSVLEGGYSDRALTSGAMAHLSGMVRAANGKVDKEWWNVVNLEKLEKATKKRRGGKVSLSAPGTMEPWLERTLAIFTSLDTGSAHHMAHGLSPQPTEAAPPSMTLRERKKPFSAGYSVRNSPIPTAAASKTKGRKSNSPKKAPAFNATDNLAEGSELISIPKKLPRVILRLGPDPQADSNAL